MLSLALYSDILAICCVKKHVCIGIGNSVDIYCIATRELVAKLGVLDDDNIHKIVKGPGSKLIVFGGKSLRICELNFIGNTIKFDFCSSVQQFNDWIISAEFSQGKENGLCILFAHNNLGLYDATQKQTSSVWCQEKCILYGGSVLPKNNQETVVLSGTVFQEILVWQVKNDREYSEDVPILHRLKGHKGVIFSVVYDPTLRLISSTSDDRTIRLWKVKNKIDSETDELDWYNSEISLTTTMYGHTARVWRSVIKNNRILSIGEDSLMCTWSLSGQLLNKIEAHHGAEIWSIDVSEDSEIFTGGADGAVNVWHFEDAEPLRVKTVFGNNSFPALPKYVCYMKSGTIVLFLDGGTLISFNADLKEIQRLSISSRYQSYCIMETSPDRMKIALGSKDGYAEIYEEYAESSVWRLKKNLEKKVMESKILSLHWTTDETILVCGDAGHLKIVDTIGEKKRVRSEFLLPSSRERWTTAAIEEKNLLICGDRAGSVFVFNLIQGDAGPTQIYPKIHGRLGVQSFSILGDKILSTGRDGTLRYYDNRQDKEQQYLQALHSHKMPMDWVCRILQYDDDLFVLGFKEVEFVIYSMNFKRFVLRYVCGGGHRSWDCRVLDGLIKFVYIKDKLVYEINDPLRNTSKAIRSGLHTKEIYCIEPIVTSGGHNIIVSAGEDSTLRVNWIAHTDSQMERFRVTPLSTFDGHISNVKTIAVLNTEDSIKCTKNFVFSGGGRAQLKVWEICVKLEKKKLTNEDVTCRELLSYMLYGTDKDRKKKWPSVKTGSFADPETRFMDIVAQVCPQDSNFILLFIACSDGFLRIFLYDTIKNNLRLSKFVICCKRCTLKVHSFVQKEDTILLTMTTDGIISFWKINEIIQNLVESTQGDDVVSEETILQFTKMKIHQSGINSFDFQKIDDSRYLILTGGDDNLISLVMFEVSATKNGLSARTLTKWESSTIHSAQITGATFVSNNRMLTTGIDQRVVVHSYSFVDGILSVLQIDEIMTFVPDVQGVTLCSPTQIDGEALACVYGKGLELIVFDQENTRR